MPRGRPNTPLLLDERKKSQRRKPEHEAARKRPPGYYAERYRKARAKALIEGKAFPPAKIPAVETNPTALVNGQPAAPDFIRRMAEQAKSNGVTPGNFLLMLVEGSTKLLDTRWEKGRLVEYFRLPTPAERQKAAETLQPYYEAKQAENVGGTVLIQHLFPGSPLANVQMDTVGKVIDAQEIEFDDLETIDD